MSGAGVTDAPSVAAVFLGGVYEQAAYYLTQAKAADLLVAADGGASFLVAHGMRPHVVVGDLDSLAPAVAEDLSRDGVDVLRYPARKNETDGELAVSEALRRGSREVILAGALGDLDHTLGHLAILRRLCSVGVAARIVSPTLVVGVVVAPAESRLDALPPTRVSLVPLSGEAIVTLKGFEYPLAGDLLPGDSCLGLGNAVAAPRSSVRVHEGIVAVLVGWGSESFGRHPSRLGQR